MCEIPVGKIVKSDSVHAFWENIIESRRFSYLSRTVNNNARKRVAHFQNRLLNSALFIHDTSIYNFR